MVSSVKFGTLADLLAQHSDLITAVKEMLGKFKPDITKKTGDPLGCPALLYDVREAGGYPVIIFLEFGLMNDKVGLTVVIPAGHFNPDGPINHELSRLVYSMIPDRFFANDVIAIFMNFATYEGGVAKWVVNVINQYRCSDLQAFMAGTTDELREKFHRRHGTS